MDFTNSKLVDLILSDGQLNSSCRDEPLFHQCLAELTACSLERLVTEPEHLRQSHHALTEQNRALAVANYDTFIRTADCSRGILADFRAVEAGAERVTQAIPQLSEACEVFLKEATKINNYSKMNAITLAKHTQVLELLEIPQLMETCVRNSYYDEALELVSYAKRLERKHSQLEIIMKIVNEVRQATQQLLNQLIQQLKGDLQLPACLKIIGYLRRMELFSEAELRLKFLQCRDSWLQTLLKAVPTDDPYQHATKVVEITRVHLFDIITQYRAVFSDEDPILSLRDEDTYLAGPANDSCLFYSWLVLKISSFLTSLVCDLDTMSSGACDSGDLTSMENSSRGSSSSAVAGRYQSLLAQCMYFGLSFSRVGCDFRPQLADIFNQAIYTHFQRCLSATISDFTTSIPVYSLSVTSSTTTASSLFTSPSEEIPPPHRLLDFPLLALLCNHILQAFNNLRISCSFNILPKIISSLTTCLQSAAQAISSYHISERDNLSPKEDTALRQLCLAFSEILLPHINFCFSILIQGGSGKTVPSDSKSVSESLLSKPQYSWQRLPSNIILSPLEALLPEEILLEDKQLTESGEQIEVEKIVAMGDAQNVTNETVEQSQLNVNSDQSSDTTTEIAEQLADTTLESKQPIGIAKQELSDTPVVEASNQKTSVNIEGVEEEEDDDLCADCSAPRDLVENEDEQENNKFQTS